MTPDQPTVLALPAPESGATANNKMDLSENTVHTVKLDELGPMVVNSDGTLSRIANWTQMTEAEQERTLRVLSARNKLRLANEEKKQQQELTDARNGAAPDSDARLSILRAGADPTPTDS